MICFPAPALAAPAGLPNLNKPALYVSVAGCLGGGERQPAIWGRADRREGGGGLHHPKNARRQTWFPAS